MRSKTKTIEEQWSLQQITEDDVDYPHWNHQRNIIRQYTHYSTSCHFTVDVFKKRYDFASENFAHHFGIKPEWLRTIRRHGDLLEDYIHPDDRDQMQDYQIQHGKFIQTLPPCQRNDYQQTFRFRMRQAHQHYVEVTSRQHVIQTDRHGKAWIIMGVLELTTAPSLSGTIQRTLRNLKTGEIQTTTQIHETVTIPTHTELQRNTNPLTPREMEILQLIRQGYLSKEIADQLGRSPYTIHNHRKQILAKLHANNSHEAIHHATQIGLWEE